MNQDHDIDFYRNLNAQPVFDSALAPDTHATLPKTWWVVIADIQNSTQAIESGSYKNVNTVGVACIAALTNVNRDIDFPFIFGGDGATAALPASMIEQSVVALRATQQLALQSFGLSLRVGLVKASDLHAQGFNLSIGKVRLSPHIVQPVLSGNGWYAAEKAVKSNAPNVQIVRADEGVAEASFEGFECRWQGVPSVHDHKLSLIVSANTRDSHQAYAIYQAVLQQIKHIYGDVNAYHPLNANRMQLTFNFKLLSHEWRVRAWGLGAVKQGLYFIKIVVQNLAGYWLFKRQMDTKAVKWSQYRHELVANSDYQKFDGMLRMVMDGKKAQAQALEHYLNAAFLRGELAYGMHQSQEALVTCIVNSHAGNHMHFVDGGSGGYALAAKALKVRIASQQM